MIAKRGKKARLRRVQPKPPPYWRRITPAAGIASLSARRDLSLVLQARGLPFVFINAGSRCHAYAPALVEGMARVELCAFLAEGGRAAPAPRPLRLRARWQWAALYVLPLIGVDFWRRLPDAPDLASAGKLDGARLFLHGEWERAATAFLLHADASHIVGNVFFGALFLCLLARICGIGHAWLLACLGGIIGNCLSALAHAPGYASIGFSTAVFAAAGALGGIALAWDTNRLPESLAAALALLAMLGTAGANTDYAAHLCGLGAGLALGTGEGAAMRKRWPLLPQWLAAIMALFLPACAWWIALARTGA